MRTAPLAAALACGFVLSHGLDAQTGPSFLMLVGDDLGVDQVGCYGRGAAPPPTPNLDRLAANGVRFTRAYADPACTPTRATILTGKHGFRTGLTNTLWLNQPGLTQQHPTYASVLQTQNYATALVGKWHVGTTYGLATPNVLGFAHFAGAMEGAIPDYWNWPRVVNGASAPSQTYATTQEVDDALAWIGAQTGPWALLLCFHAPHAPYHAPPAGLHTQNLAGLDPGTTPLPFYRAMVEALDTEIGRLLAGIGAAALANTNVVFVGDNGTPSDVTVAPFAPAHAKNTVYEGGVNVPLIVAGPSVGAPGTSCDALVNTVDLYPTIFELCRVAASSLPSNAGQDGQSIAPLLRDAAAPRRSTAYVEVTGFSYNALAIVGPRYKLVRLRGAEMRDELFDLGADPFEQNDLLLQPLTAEATVAWQHLQAELSALRPPGSLRPFGTGCTGAVVAPRLTGVIPPQVGLRAAVLIDNVSPGARLVIGIFGVGNSSFAGSPLPLDLTPFGMPACELLIEAGYLSYAGFTGGLWSVQVPRSPSVAGRSFFLQAFVREPGVNPAGIVASAGIEGVIGQ